MTPRRIQLRRKGWRKPPDAPVTIGVQPTLALAVWMFRRSRRRS